MTASASTSSAADPVDIGLWDIGEVVIEDVADAIDIDASGGDIGCHEDLDLSLAKHGEGPVSLPLGLIAMNGNGVMASLFHNLLDPICPVFGAHKDDGLIDGIVGQQRHKGLWLLTRINDHERLLDSLDGLGCWRNRNFLRLV